MGCKPCKDHLGRKFNSQKEMLEKWGVSYYQFRKRKAQGATLRNCLKRTEDCVDEDVLTDMYNNLRGILENEIVKSRQG